MCLARTVILNLREVIIVIENNKRFVPFIIRRNSEQYAEIPQSSLSNGRTEVFTREEETTMCQHYCFHAGIHI